MIEQVPFPADWGFDPEFRGALRGTVRDGESRAVCSLRVGDRLDAYRVVGEIARGTLSGVYEAVEEPGGRRLALKVLSSEHTASTAVVTRFCAEAALAERVSHPAIVRVLGCTRSEDHYFYTMHLTGGASLADLVLASEPPRKERFFVELAERFAPVAEAVDLLHTNGIVHRALEPSNILVDAEGRFFLTDFGSAVDRELRDPLLEDNPAWTAPYTSPEQLAPGADPYDVSADVYSLGATLYEVSAGVPAFPTGSEAEIARLKLTHEPPSPRHWNSHVPLGLEAIIRQAMAGSPQLRHPTAGDLARDLERFASRHARRRGEYL